VALDDLRRRIRDERTAVLVVNTQSRRGARAYADAERALVRRGLKLVGSYPVTHARELPSVVRQAVSDGHPLIVVGGGDGTISAIVDDFAYRDVALGLLPLGTGNSYARTIGIPLSVEGAADVIAAGVVDEVDLGRIRDDYFANVASMGFLGTCARRTTERLKRRLGPLAYIAVALAEFVRHRPFVCEIRSESGTVRVRTHQVVIANGSFLGKSFVPQLRPDDATLAVYTMDMLNRWQLVPFWLAFATGRFRAHSRARYFRTRQAWFQAVPVQQLDVDGEPGDETPVEVTLAARALKLVVPPAFIDERREGSPALEDEPATAGDEAASG
jgi:YegS/Rv2252/BmrU family lipid kinase